MASCYMCQLPCEEGEPLCPDCLLDADDPDEVWNSALTDEERNPTINERRAS